MEEQQKITSSVTRIALVLILVIATAWIVLHGRVTTTGADLTEGKCGGCRYATECLKQEQPAEAVKRCHAACQVESDPECRLECKSSTEKSEHINNCKSACNEKPIAGGCHEE